MIFQFFALLILFVACSHHPVSGDRELKASEIPQFLASYNKRNVRFYEKYTQSAHTYEVKSFENDQEISLTFSSHGEFLEREEDIEFETLPSNTQKKILSYLSENFPKYKMVETEKRQTAENASLIDIEIKHRSSKSGYWEVTFNSNGDYISQELEDYPIIETLN